MKADSKTREAPVGDREPPHSVEAEQSVLGGVLLDNRVHPVAVELLTSAVPPKQRQLLELLRGGAKSNNALCELTGQDKSAMSHMLRDMESRGLVQRIANGWVALH